MRKIERLIIKSENKEERNNRMGGWEESEEERNEGEDREYYGCECEG